MAKRGQPPSFVRDRDGKEIHGLSAQPAKNRKGEITGYRFYATFSDPRVWIGTYPTRDDPVGIMEFRRWEYQRTGEKIDIIITKPIRKDNLFDTGEDDWSTWTKGPWSSAARRRTRPASRGPRAWPSYGRRRSRR